MLSLVRIQALRNLTEFTLIPHSKYNLLSGPNGTGKTALLEALCLLSTGYSFRTREIAPLIQFDQTCLTLFSKLENGQTISIQKSYHAPTQVRLNGQACSRASELAYLLPSQVVYQDIFEIINAGPSIRRRLLDWGVFHVKHDYHEKWKQYRQALKQRNILLKNNAPQAQLQPWNKTLSELADFLHKSREAYIQLLTPIFYRKLEALSQLKCTLTYKKGWSDSEDGLNLEAILYQSYEQDRLRKYTQYGPHHADLILSIESGKMKHYLSRGQQKVILLALKLAQAQLLTKPCLFLWDDVASELDTAHLKRLTALIEETPGQFFLTGVDIESTPLGKLSGENVKMGLVLS